MTFKALAVQKDIQKRRARDDESDDDESGGGVEKKRKTGVASPQKPLVCFQSYWIHSYVYR